MTAPDAFTFVAALLALVGGLVSMVVAARRRRTFTHDGRTYTRSRNGSFMDSAGVPVESAVLAGALAVAYGAHLQKLRASGSGSDGGGDASGSSDGGSWFGGDSGGDGGGSDGGGGDGGGGSD